MKQHYAKESQAEKTFGTSLLIGGIYEVHLIDTVWNCWGQPPCSSKIQADCRSGGVVWHCVTTTVTDSTVLVPLSLVAVTNILPPLRPRSVLSTGHLRAGPSTPMAQMPIKR